MFCASCGAEIEPNQKFCEKCGSSVSTGTQGGQVAPVAAPSTQVTTLGFQPYDRPGGLFDMARNYYILKEKY
jgi:hypothetical protein